jgi:hypothetical protein
MKKIAFNLLIVFVAALTVISCTKATHLDSVSQPANKTLVGPPPPPPSICDSTAVNLIAGQYMDAGKVIVKNNSDTLFVTYVTSGDWKISEIHLYVGPKSELPANKKGNPKVGHFPTQDTFYPMVTTVTYKFLLENLDDCFYIAAHAVVKKVVDGQILDSQTAWGDGFRIIDKGNWAMYFEYCPGVCE